MLPPKYLILFADVRKNGCKGMSCLQRNDQLSVTQYISGNIPHLVSQPSYLATLKGCQSNLSAFFVDMSCHIAYAICQSNQAKIIYISKCYPIPIK